MTRHDAALLTLRAFALYAWFQALEFFAGGLMTGLLSTTFKGQGDFTIYKALSVFAPSLLFTAIGAFLFIRSRELASWLLSPPSSDTAMEHLPSHPLPAASLAFAVVGVAMFLYATPRALNYAITFASIDNPKIRAQRFGFEEPRVIGTAGQLVLSFFLTLKSRTFATAWWRKQQPKPRE